MPNRLAGEASPYLRQHADNPVDWYPWGAEARELARRLDRPLLLSVGYSACHWCHVMAHESFSDPGVAERVNRHFVAVKVDREEHPDVDAVYQLVCQIATGTGGWPLTVFLTPDLEPFYVGTYFPPSPRWGRPSFLQVVEALGAAWDSDRARLLEVAVDWRQALAQGQRRLVAVAGPDPTHQTLEQAVQALAEQVDPLHGGFGPAPKFPHSAALELMLRAGGVAARRAIFTLRAMAAGGIADQLGGGFHRYSTDERWRVPHFEKMLYDNALLVPVYLSAWQRTSDTDLAAVATSTLEYMLREMRAPDGGFYSAEDADSLDAAGQPAEGAFYTWTPAEVQEALGDRDLAQRVCQHLGIRPGGDLDGRGVPHLEALSGEPDADLARGLTLLRAARAMRRRPARDTKVLTGWNGLALRALARAGRLLPEQGYLEAARQTAEMLLTRRDAQGGLWRTASPAGGAGIPGALEDYAFVAIGLIELYEATLEGRWLEAALGVARAAVARFWDEQAAAFYLALDTGLPLRPREDPDSGTPAAQSLMLEALVRLAPLGEPAWAELAWRVLRRCQPLLTAHPAAMASLLSVLDRLCHPLEVVLGGSDEDRLADWRAQLARLYLPNLSLSRVRERTAGTVPPAWQGRPAGGPATLWVCQGTSCLPPARSWEEVRPVLEGAVPPALGD